MNKTIFLGHELDFPLISAPCPLAWGSENLIKIGQTAVPIVTTKSVSLHPREGNESPREWYSDLCSINSVGIANDGIEAHLRYMDDFSQVVEKPLLLNLVGFDVSEWEALMVATKDRANILALELNFSCPNHEGAVWADSPEMMDSLLSRIDTPHRRGVKVNPCTDKGKIKEIVAVLLQHKIDYVVCSNTLGNCLVLDQQGQPVIKAKNGYGGMGGAALKPLSLSTVSLYREALGSDFPLVGLGGISTGQDLKDYIAAGATIGAVSSILMHEGLEAVERIKNEYKLITKK